MMTEVKVNTKRYRKTKIFHEEKLNQKFGQPAEYSVYGYHGKELTSIKFQQGPIETEGVNGITNEDLLHILSHRFRSANKNGDKTTPTTMATLKVEEALMWLQMKYTEVKPKD